MVLPVTWCIAPWVGYWALLAFVGLAGLFVVPTFSIVRQVLIGAVADEQRTAVLSVDSVVVEFSFMIGPVLGVLAAVYLDTAVALMICQLVAALGTLVLWIDNPPIVQESQDGAAHHRLRDWLTPAVMVVFALCVGATVILTGEDLGIVAAMRAMQHTSSIGWVLALWGFGSALGGIVYGALPRHPPAAVLLVLLGASTTGVALADGRFALRRAALRLRCLLRSDDHRDRRRPDPDRPRSSTRRGDGLARVGTHPRGRCRRAAGRLGHRPRRLEGRLRAGRRPRADHRRRRPGAAGAAPGGRGPGARCWLEVRPDQGLEPA